MPTIPHNRGLCITDGAWGTQLDALGCPAGYCREQWNTDNPDAVRQVAQQYIDAGSQAVLTNTFTGNRIILSRHHLADRAADLSRAGAAISRQAAGKDVRVFGSMGPSGQIVMMEEIDRQELYDAFAEQASALAEGGVNGIVCESMTELAEIIIAVSAAKKTTGLPVVASMVFDSGAERCFTSMGDNVEKVASPLADAGADVVGINCGVGMAEVIVPVSRLRDSCDLPIWVKPNAGLPELVEGKVRYKETPQEFASHVGQLLEIGVDYIGGCCGSTPDHIRAVVEAVSKAR
jgi:5-methyltetrahydrofolate--homocysteine methyltransferase